MARRVIVSVVLVVVFLAVGVGALSGLRALRQQAPRAEPERRPLKVSAVELRPVTIVAPLEGFGTARADRLAVIGAQISGQVMMLAPDLRDGSAVTAGDMLLQIDQREYQAQLDRARGLYAAAQAALEQIDIEERNLRRLVETATGELDLAEREYSRVLELFESGTSNPRELDVAKLALKRARRTVQTLEGELDVIPKRRVQAQAACESRQAEVTLAELDLERCAIVAPFSGVVEHLLIEVGEQVRPGQQLLSVLDPELIEVPIELGVSWRERVRVGAAAGLMLESRPELAWSGNVARISPSADEATRTFSLFVEVRNSGQSSPLVPGMFVRARIDGPTLSDVLVVPRGAVRREHVFVCEDGLARPRGVRIEQRLLDRAVISGLSPGDVVITSNLDALSDGTPVSPVLRDGLATAPPAAGHATDASDPTAASGGGETGRLEAGATLDAPNSKVKTP